MVRICRREVGGRIELSVQGRLVGPWVEELRREVLGLEVPTSAVELDLARVGYVDGAGQELLRRLVAGGLRLGPRSGFVQALLDGWEGEGRP